MLSGSIDPGNGRPELQLGRQDFFFFVSTVLISISALFFLRFTSVSLPYSILAVPWASVQNNTHA